MSIVRIDIQIEDDAVLTAQMKAQFDEQILDEVVRYMIMNTIIRLRLDTPDKVKEYCKH